MVGHGEFRRLLLPVLMGSTGAGGPGPGPDSEGTQHPYPAVLGSAVPDVGATQAGPGQGPGVGCSESLGYGRVRCGRAQSSPPWIAALEAATRLAAAHPRPSSK